MNQEPNPQTPPLEDTAESGSLDAAALAFSQRDEPAPEQDVKPEATEQAEEVDPNAEAQEGQPDEDTDAEELEEVELEGLKLSVPKGKAEAIRNAALRQADYSRKMNEVSAKEKATQQRIEQAEKLAEGAASFAKVLAEVQMVDARIQQFEGVNWQQLRQDNPAEYAAYASDLQSLRMAKQQAEARAAHVFEEVKSAKDKTLQEKREAMFGEVSKALGGWDDEKGTRITQYAINNGVSVDSLQSLTDPGLVIALEKARKYDALQASKATVKAAVKGVPPVLKPGAPRQSNPHSDALSRLRKSNSVDDAAAAFLAKMG